MTSSTHATVSGQKTQNEHQILCRYIQISIEKNSKENLERLFKELDCFDRWKPDSIRKWYLALSQCIPLLQLRTKSCRYLLAIIFERFRWDFPVETLKVYSEFCTLLISTYPVTLKPVLQSCTANFIDRCSDEKVYPTEGMSSAFPILHRFPFPDLIDI